jgi:hypothetical protein
MPTILKTKNSVTTTVVPTTLQQGELAVNITDKKLWVGNAATTPVQLLGAGVTGDVVGPASSTDNAVARFDGTTGKIIQNSAVTIADTTGDITTAGYLITAAGAVGTPALTTTGDTNTGIFFPAADTIAFSEGGAEAMRIDSDGDVGIGTDSPAQKLHIAGTGDTRLQVESTSSGAGVIYLNASTAALAAYNTIQSRNGSTVQWAIGGSGTENALPFYTNGTTERMRIDSSGNVLVGTTSVPSTTGGSGFISSTNNRYLLYLGSNSSGANNLAQFYNSNGQVGSISVSGSSTAYNTSSDYRLKENIAPMTGALAKVQTLKPVTYTWKANGSDGQGFIAHELQEVVPYAVSGEKDGELMQGVDYGKITPLLTAALQEALVKIELLEARLAVLESK